MVQCNGILSAVQHTNMSLRRISRISASQLSRASLSPCICPLQHRNYASKTRNPPSLSHPRIRDKRNREHLNRLIRAMERYINEEKFIEADQVWQRIQELKYLALNENVVNTYMKALLKRGEHEALLSLFQKYFESGEMKPSKRSYNILMHSYAEQGKVREVESLIAKMLKDSDRDVQPNEISYTNLVKAVLMAYPGEEGQKRAWEKYKEIFITSPTELGTVAKLNHGRGNQAKSKQQHDSAEEEGSDDTTTLDIFPSHKLIPMATTTKLLLQIRGDEALPLVRMWIRNKEIPQIMLEYFCETQRLDEALLVFGEFFECPYFSKNAPHNDNIKKQFPHIGVYNKLVDLVLFLYEEGQQQDMDDEQLDEYLNVGSTLYDSFMENGTSRMTTELANKFLYIFIELGKTEEAFLQIYRRFFVPPKAVSRRTLIQVNMPTYSETRGQYLEPTRETFALMIRGAENDGLAQVEETLRFEMTHFLQREKEMKEERKRELQEEEV